MRKKEKKGDVNYNQSGFFDIPNTSSVMSMETVTDSSIIFDEDDGSIDVSAVPGKKKEFFVNFGFNNLLPYDIIHLVGQDEVMSQNKLFNVLTCFGQGPTVKDAETGRPTHDAEIREWLRHNNLDRFMLEQATDMKYFFYCISVIILSRDGKRINRLQHKEACHCRLERADAKGKIQHVYYANWRKQQLKGEEVERIPLLDINDPLGDLQVRMGLAAGDDGKKRERTSDRKFAIMVRFPTPGNQYYPIPYYTSIFRGDWYDIKRLIGKGKKAKLRNHASVKYQVEVHKDYWEQLCDNEKIYDPVKRVERINKEKDNIKNFVAGIENSGKVWITGYYIDPNKVEQRMVRINQIEAGKEGGDWSEDIEEASNITCYGDNIHPNLVGATPGKSQSNNSGSDKRELFTLKQSVETAFKRIMMEPYKIVINYNGWDDKVYLDIPIILLTTLDQNTDAKTISTYEYNNNNPS